MDWDYVKTLLDIAAATRDYPKLKNMHDYALAELEKMSADESFFDDKEEVEQAPVDQGKLHFTDTAEPVAKRI